MSLNKETKSAWQRGIVAFLVIAASILFFFFIYRFDVVWGAVSRVIKVLSPVTFGLVISYLLNPLVDLFNKKLFPKIFRRKKNDLELGSGHNMLAVCLSLLIFVFVIVGMVVLIIPQLINSFSKVVDTLPGRIDHLIKWGDKILKENKTLETAFERVLNYEKKWLKNDLAGFINAGAEYFASGVMGVLNFLKNFAIGFMIAIYVLYNKTKFGNKSRKVMYALFKESTVIKILAGLSKSNSVFSGFIFGKLLDSLIIGILCFIGVTLMNIPYTMLVAVTIGVTNIIPVFGPYIGAVPCAALILMTDPLKGLYFIIFIILLQILDGNIIGPKILGDKTGLETFWVIFAIILGGGLFGMGGLIIGVPLFAIIYYFISVAINDRLRGKKLPTEAIYYSSECIDYSSGEEDTKDA